MRRLPVWALGILLLATASTARAHVPPDLRGRRVAEVEVEGVTEGFTAAREIGIPLGAPVSRRMLRAAVQRLVQSGRWADVQIDLVPVSDGVKVVAHLVPRLVVARLEILGNEEIDEADLKRIVGLRRTAEFRREQLPGVVDEVEAAYAERGYEHAHVRIQLWDTDDPSRKVVRVRIHEGPPTRITALRFAGQAPPPESDVADAIGLELGDPLDRREVSEGVRRGEERLRKRGWLEAHLGPARFEREEGGVAVTVPSRVGPRYRVVVAGARPLERSDVVEVLRHGEERLAGPANLEAMRGRVVDLYHRHGFHDVDVQVLTVPGPEEGQARLLVAVEPGEPLEVVRVTFPGARHFERPFLRSQVFSFLQEDIGEQSLLEPVDTHTVDQLGFGDDTRWRGREVPRPLEVDPKKVYYEPTYERAVEHLQELYQSEGFLGAEVGQAELERLEGNRALVVIPIIEGPRTMLHAVELRGNEMLTSRTLLEGTELARGMPFSHFALDRAKQSMMEVYRDHGHFYARVDAKVIFSPDRTRAHVTFQIVERYPVHIGEILVQGADRTKESLVLDRIPFERGDLYRPAVAREAQKRLMQLGVFNSVTVAPQDAELPEKVKNIVVTVTERATQFIDFSAGVSTGQGIRGGFEYGYRNLFGYAVGLSLRVQLGHQFFFLDNQLQNRFQQLSLADRLERTVTLGLTIPHLSRLPKVRTAVNLFHQRDNERDFGLDKNGVGVTFTYRPLDWLTVALSEDLENNNLDLLLDNTNYDEFLANTTDPRLQRLLRVPQGRSTLVATRLNASFDFRDSPFVPTKGVLVSGRAEWARTLRTQSVEIADIEEEFFSHHIKLSLSTTGYIPLAEKVVLAAQVRFGRVVHLSGASQTYPNRQFFLGGADSLRGFRVDALIPQDRADRFDETELEPGAIPRGGDSFVILRSELRFPIVGDVHAGVFADLGNVWAAAGGIEPFDLRPTAGLGLRIATPVGPLAFDYGVNILRRQNLNERFGAFHFSIGVF